MDSICQFSAFYFHFQVTSSKITSLMNHFMLPEVTWRYILSHDCLLLRATALKVVKCTVYASFRSPTSTSMWLPLKWRHFRVTSGHLRSRGIISCHVTASSYEIQPCRKSNTEYTPVFSLLQPLPGRFRSNDNFRVTSVHLKSREVISGHVTACSCKPQPCMKLNSQCTQVFGLLQSIPCDFRSNDVIFGSPRVTWGHVSSFPLTWLRPSSDSL